jgi:hypothetical protein
VLLETKTKQSCHTGEWLKWLEHPPSKHEALSSKPQCEKSNKQNIIGCHGQKKLPIIDGISPILVVFCAQLGCRRNGRSPDDPLGTTPLLLFRYDMFTSNSLKLKISDQNSGIY